MNLSKFHKAFENKVRLGVMAILVVNEEVSFNELKELLDVTDGNLATHIKALEKENFIEVHKTFVDRKPNTSYTASSEGKKAFEKHLEALESIIHLKP